MDAKRIAAICQNGCWSGRVWNPKCSPSPFWTRKVRAPGRSNAFYFKGPMVDTFAAERQVCAAMSECVAA